MKYRKQSHCVYYCEYHLVFATKYRRKIFNDGIFAYMQERLKQIKDHYPELDIIKVNHDVDHIHLLIVIPPKMSVSQVVRIIKSNTSKDLKKKFGFLLKFWQKWFKICYIRLMQNLNSKCQMDQFIKEIQKNFSLQ